MTYYINLKKQWFKLINYNPDANTAPMHWVYYLDGNSMGRANNTDGIIQPFSYMLEHYPEEVL